MNLILRFRFRTLIFSPPTRNSDREYPRHAKTTTIHLLSTAASAAPVRSVRDRRMLVIQRSRVAAMLPSFEHMIGLRIPKKRALGNSLAYAVTGGASLRTISKPDG